MVSRRAALALGILVVVGLAADAWVALGRDTTAAPDAAHPRLTELEYTAAMKAAHQVQGTVKGTFVSATATAGPGRVRQSNTGHPCTSGRVVRVRLIWMAGASFMHGGFAGPGPPDGPRQALSVTADAATGQPCLIGASYSHVAPRPGETFLYGPTG
jgi:hypothetical protein